MPLFNKMFEGLMFVNLQLKKSLNSSYLSPCVTEWVTRMLCLNVRRRLHFYLCRPTARGKSIPGISQSVRVLSRSKKSPSFDFCQVDMYVTICPTITIHFMFYQ